MGDPRHPQALQMMNPHTRIKQLEDRLEALEDLVFAMDAFLAGADEPLTIEEKIMADVQALYDKAMQQKPPGGGSVVPFQGQN